MREIKERPWWAQVWDFVWRKRFTPEARRVILDTWGLMERPKVKYADAMLRGPYRFPREQPSIMGYIERWTAARENRWEQWWSWTQERCATEAARHSSSTVYAVGKAVAILRLKHRPTLTKLMVADRDVLMVGLMALRLADLDKIHARERRRAYDRLSHADGDQAFRAAVHMNRIDVIYGRLPGDTNGV